MYIGISAPGIGRHPPRVAMALRTTRLGFHIVRDGIDPGDYRFLLWFIGVVYIYMYICGRISDPGIGSYPPRVALALRTQGYSFHTVRGGIDPGGHRCRPRIIGAVDVREDF